MKCAVNFLLATVWYPTLPYFTREDSTSINITELMLLINTTWINKTIKTFKAALKAMRLNKSASTLNTLSFRNSHLKASMTLNTKIKFKWSLLSGPN